MSDPTQLDRQRWAVREATGEWLRIETAPTSGEPIFVCHRDNYPNSIYVAIPAGPWLTVTHWMPIPEGPSK